MEYGRFLLLGPCVCTIVALASCADPPPAVPRDTTRWLPVSPAPPTLTMAPDVKAHLTEMMDVMERNHYRRLDIDWVWFRDKVLYAAPHARTLVDAFPAIQQALVLLGDHHSSYRSTSGTALSDPYYCSAANVPVESLPTNIAYVRVTALADIEKEITTPWAQSLQDAIRLGDRPDVVGWIVDLRHNTGGNMWPMIAGIGPLLGADTAGYFIEPTDTIAWGYAGGAAWLDGVVIQSVPSPHAMSRPNMKVAVLTDGLVASSGEAVAAAFRRRPNTMFFGMPTCGLTTAIEAFPLSNGARLNLATSVFADRARVAYGWKIEPDEVAPWNQTIARALVWLLQ